MLDRRVNANALGTNVIYPPVTEPQAVSLVGLDVGEVHRIEAARCAFLVRRAGEGIQLWPGVCPDEGACIEPGQVRENVVRCFWHGLEFGMRPLRPRDAATICGAFSS